MKRLLAYLACACLLVCTVATATAQTLTSDKQDYAPGETATLTGTGFASNETVTLQVLHADGSPSSGAEHETWTVVADVNGAFTATWHVCEDDCVGALLEATAVGQSGLRASVQFTDAANIDCGPPCSPSLKDGNVPSSGAAVVNGVMSSGEWNLTTDLWTNMYVAGDPSKPLISRAYVKFVCNADKTVATVYVLVKAEPGQHINVDSPCGTDSWIKICGLPGSQKAVDSCDPASPAALPNFKYGGLNGSGTEAQFYEAAFTLPAGATYKVFPHAHVQSDGGGTVNTSAAGSGSVCMTLTCPTGCSTPPVFSSCSSTPVDLHCNPTTIPGCDNSITARDCQGNPVTVECNIVDDAHGCAHTRTITYTATDSFGNTANCTQVYTWTEDTTPPLLANLPAGGDLGCNPATLPSCSNAVTATDDCSGTLTVSCVAGPITGPDCAKTQTFTYSATDGCGNIASEPVTYTWKIDTTPPVLVGVPASGDLGCNPPPPVCADVTATDNCDEIVTVTCSEGLVSNTSPCGRSQTFTYKATDSCGNSVSQDVTLTWTEDTTGPALANVPLGGDLGCNPTGLPSCSNGVTASDDCSGSVSVTCTPGEITGPDCAKSQTFTYSATDGCHNTTSQEVTYTWKIDTAPPEFVGLPSGGDLGCNPNPLPACDDAVTATDNCDGPGLHVECFPSEIKPGPEPCQKQQAFTYVAIDACGNEARESVVYTWTEDTTPPVIQRLPVGGYLGCNIGPKALPRCANLFAFDDCMLDKEGRPVLVKVECIPGRIVEDGCNRSQTFTYRAVDNCKNVASEDVTYTWKEDLEHPILENLPAGGDLGCNPATLPICDDNVTATDKCDGPVQVACTDGGITDVGTCGKSQTFTYSATDGCGNTVSQDVTYTWKEDTTAPALANVPTGGDLGCNPATPPACSSDVTATDNCDGTVNVTCHPGDVTGPDCAKSQTFTYSAVDACGNTVSQDVTYTWKIDTTAPVLANVPAGGDLGCNPTPPSCSDAVTATDDCDGTVEVACKPGPILGEGKGCFREQTFVYSAVDACGNPVSEAVKYTWTEDHDAPVLPPLPTGKDLGCNPRDLPDCSRFRLAAAKDLCDGFVPVSCTSGKPVVDGCHRTLTFTFSAIDKCGNVARQDVVFTWTEDHAAPKLQNLPTGGDLGCNPAPPVCDPNVSAIDDCDASVTVDCAAADVVVNGCMRSQDFTYSARDACGNFTSQTVTYTWKEDHTAPTLANLPASSDLGCNPVTLPSCSSDVTATDDCDGPLQVHCEAGPITGPDCAKSQTFTYSVTDGCGNTTSQDVTYTWKIDTTAPVLANMPAGGDLGCNPTRPSCSNDVTATDNCDGKVSVNCAAGDVTNVGTCGKSQTFTYSAVDACGNPVSQTVTYTWKEDTTAPVLANLPTGGDLGCNPTPPSCSNAVTATDDCDGTVDVTCSAGPITNVGTCGRRQTFTYSAKDGCGNPVSQDVTYTWTVDTTPPTISCTNIVVSLNAGDACPTLVNFSNFTASDDCGSVTVSPLSGTFPVGTTSVTITATDGCGNKATCTFDVTVKSAVCVNKFNDYNANGVQDSGEPGLSGVTFTLTPGGQTATTDANGKACFSGLVAGNYTVTETLQSGWINISPKSQTVTLGCPATLQFGNVKLGGCGGLTLGFWSNKNGQALETAGDFSALTALCLRNADGSNRDFVAMLSVNKTNFAAWLLSANATNMANMLSAQLAAMTLNVAHGNVSGTALVYAPGCGNTGPGNAFISVNSLLAAANAELCAHPVTLSGSPYRATQECLQQALNSANNNLNFIVTPNCPTASGGGGSKSGGTTY